MNKRKIRQVSVVWENGEKDTWDVDATFSESINARKKNGFKNEQEWAEYHITWITYVQDLPEVEPQKSQEELEAEWEAKLAEKRKNPLYAGTADGRDFYHSPPPTFESWENFIAELGKESKNGRVGS